MTRRPMYLRSSHELKPQRAMLRYRDESPDGAAPRVRLHAAPRRAVHRKAGEGVAK